jgi:hypothetical protein
MARTPPGKERRPSSTPRTAPTPIIQPMASAWFAEGDPENLVASLKEREARYPGNGGINLSTPIGTPEAAMPDRFRWPSKAVLRAFGKR